MLDLILANKLIKAVPPGAHLLLVGDPDQLPSVGAGNVLQDLLTMMVTLQCLDIVPHVVPGKTYFTPEHGLHLSFLLSDSRRRQRRLLLTHLQGLLINMARFFVFPLQPGTLTQKL